MRTIAAALLATSAILLTACAPSEPDHGDVNIACTKALDAVLNQPSIRPTNKDGLADPTLIDGQWHLIDSFDYRDKDEPEVRKRLGRVFFDCTYDPDGPSAITITDIYWAPENYPEGLDSEQYQKVVFGRENHHG